MFKRRFPTFNSFYFLLGFNILMFVLTYGLSLLINISVDNSFGVLLYVFGGLQNSLATAGEWWRLITSTFLHADILHILFNMIALYQIGRLVYHYYGGKFLFYAYIFCGLMGSILSIIFLGPTSATVGASGAVFGLIGVLLAGSYKRNRYGLDLPFSPMDILPLALYSFFIGLIPGSNVNNWAHLGGFLMGLLLGVVVHHKLTPDQQSWRKVLDNVLLIISVILFIGAYAWMIISLPSLLNLI